MQKVGIPESSREKEWALKIERPIGILLSLGILGCFVHAVTLQGWPFFKLPFYLACAFAVLAFLVSMTSGSNVKFARKLLLGLRAALGSVITGTLGFSMILGVVYALTELWGYASGNIAASYKTSILVGFLTLVVGVFFFLIRIIWRFTYGVTEIGAGVFIASYRALGTEHWFSAQNLDLYLVVLTAGVYLVVRGLDNASQGFNKPNDPMIRAGRWLKSLILVSDQNNGRELNGGD